MDKHSPRISIKVNGMETKHEEKPLPLEQRENAEAMFPVIEAPTNIVPFRNEYEVNVPQRQRSNAGKRIAISVGAAVLLGTGFGVTVLHILNGNEQEIREVSQAVTTPVQADEVKDKTAADGITLQPLSAYVMQAGVFSTRENGQAELAALKKQGIPAALRPKDGKFYLFTVVANDEQTAIAIGKSYKIEGTVPYFKVWEIKETTVPAAYQKYSNLLSKTQGFLITVLQQSSLYFTSGKIDEKEWEQMEKSLQTLTKEGQTVEQEEVKKLLTYISLAYDGLKDYKQQKDSEALVKLQQLLLDGLISYEAMLTVNKNS